jgi:hypothetical protein
MVRAVMKGIGLHARVPRPPVMDTIVWRRGEENSSFTGIRSASLKWKRVFYSKILIDFYLVFL